MRGCVRVTGRGVEDVLSGCWRLRAFDVSQCRNLVEWLEDEGGKEKWGAVLVTETGMMANGGGMGGERRISDVEGARMGGRRKGSNDGRVLGR